MVFESVLIQVLNRFLGDYVENLDRNQLNVGIWGGDVELRNLVLKQSALEELDLPVQTIYGRIGTLVLKIPWKNLYSAAVVIDIEDIYLLAAPNLEVRYNADKEEKQKIESKKKDLVKLETAKKLAAEKDNPKKTDYTFVEKFVTQIIKNVQLNVKNIHMRYEDKVTSPWPFSLGVSLASLTVVSTDSHWKPAITKEDIKKIFKIVQLEALAVYWNCDSDTYGGMAADELIRVMSGDIAQKETQPSGYTYILGPINASARLRINQKPELDEQAYSVPKIHLNLDMQKLSVGISKAQYRDILSLVESMTRMSKGIPYRKYRPHLQQYRGHYKQWWKFAITCVLEGEVKRRRQNWNWDHILGHRQMCKEYGELYKKKLKNAANTGDVYKIDECELRLDLFNIVLIRQRIEMETERLDKKQASVEKKTWFGWMWGSSAKDDSEELAESTDILKQFQEAMTKEEKERLFKAIDYQENATPTQYPETFVDNSCTFVLRTLELELRDDENVTPRVLFTELKGVNCKLDTRTSASAISVNVRIDEFHTRGMQQDDFIPNMINTEIGKEASGLLEVNFETNPLDKSCSQRLKVMAQPLKVVYDAETINKIIDVFRPPPCSDLESIAAAADSRLTNFKEMSSTGLQYAIERHVNLQVEIDLRAPYIIIPQNGKYTGTETVLVVNLGNLLISSEPRVEYKDVRNLHAQGLPEKEILKQMIAQSYDQFDLRLTDLQILLAQGEEPWQDCIKESRITDMHLLSPVSLHVQLFKCLIIDDPRLPLTKIAGSLPSFSMVISDARLLLLVGLVTSIPLPEGDIPEPRPLSRDMKRESSMVMLKYLEMQENAKKTLDLLPSAQSGKDFVQFTTVQIHFVMSECSVRVVHQDDLSSPSTPIAEFTVQRLEFALLQQTYNTKVTLRLASIGLRHFYSAGPVDIIQTPDVDTNKYLFIVEFTQVNRKSPEFHSVYKSCESALNLKFARVGIILHKESLLEIIRVATRIQSDLEAVSGSDIQMDRIASANIRDFKSQLSAIAESQGNRMSSATSHQRKKTRIVVETIKLKLSASLQQLTVDFVTLRTPLSHCAIKGIRTEIILKTNYTQINANLKEITVKDLNPKSVHKNILSVDTDQDALTARVVIFNSEGVEQDRADISVDCTLGGIRIIYLNLFFMRMLNFLNEFQAAQAKLIEASQAAAQSARENMQSAYEKATKISLNIDLKAPDLIIPANSKSYDGVLVDLGHLSVLNKFSTLDIKDGSNHSPVIDEMRLCLNEMKVSRVKLDADSQIAKELTLLEPVNFKLIIKRNLSSVWYKEIPDLDVSGKILTISLMLSHIDYETIMSVVNGNLAEGQVKTQSYLATKAEVSPRRISRLTSTVEGLDGRPIEYESHISVFLRFTFSMDRLNISLFNGGCKELTEKDAPHPDDSLKGLARFSLEGISVKCRILSDQSIIMSCLLVNCFLDDIRAGHEEQLNRLVQRTVEVPSPTKSSADPVRSMIDVTFQTKEGNTFVDVRIYSFTMILSVEFLLKLGEFFKVGPVEQEAKLVPLTAKPSERYIKAAHSKSKAAVVDEPQITVNLKVEKPDIILVEQMDMNTNALILNSEITIKLRMAGRKQVINGSVKDLQLYTCAYDPARRAETRYDVLHPVSINLAGSTPEHLGLHIELMVTNIFLSVSPATIELLTRVSQTATGGGPVVAEASLVFEDRSTIWDLTPYTEDSFWFLKAEEGEDVLEDMPVHPTPTEIDLTDPKELCIVSIPSIVVTLEAGVGNKTIPMLMLESSFKGEVRNWSKELKVDAGLTIEMGYYNNRLAVWEPLIEPVEVHRNAKSRFVPWELRLEVVMNDLEEEFSPIDGDASLEMILRKPAMCISLLSEHILELIVTKTCIEVLNNLSKAFTQAMELKEVKGGDDTDAPYKVVNELGTKVTLVLDRGSFAMFDSKPDLEVILEHGAEVPLQLRSLVPSPSLHLDSELRGSGRSQKDYVLPIRIQEKNCNIDLPVVRADKRFFPFTKTHSTNDSWGLISDIVVEDGVTIITLRSILKVYNHFSIPVEVYYMTQSGNELALIAEVRPESSLNLPLNTVYTQTNELFFTVNGYTVSTTPYVWKELQTNVNVTKTLHCEPKNVERGSEPLIIQAVGEMEQVFYESTGRHTMGSACYNIHLRPAVKFKNCLPVDVVCAIENMIPEFEVKAGCTLHLTNVEPDKSCMVVRLPNYLEKEWSSRHEIKYRHEEFAVWTFNSYDSAVKMTLNLGLHTVTEHSSMILELYCPFWMLNKTGMMLAYRTSEEGMNVIHHPPDFKGPVLFSFNAKNFFGKKKAGIRIEQGEWSDKFSIDVAGSSGVVVCKHNGMIHQIGVHNQLTYNGLTKQITFTPYYVIINNAPYPIECQEHDRPADRWYTVAPNSCSALWPKSELDDKLLRLRVAATKDISPPFLYTESHTTLLKLKNQHGGVNVDIQMTEGGIYINLAAYQDGMAPALIVNDTRDTMSLWEKDSVQIKKLPSRHSMLYTWDNPSGPRVLAWEGGNRKEFHTELRQDGLGEYNVKENYHIYWVCFLDGMQRILLFTHDAFVAENAQAANLFEIVNQEITVSLMGVGISLVNNTNRQDIMYLGIASSGVIWEQSKSGGARFKPMSQKESNLLEEVYQKYLNNTDEFNQRQEIVLMDNNKTRIDFRNGLMTKQQTERQIRRAFQTGMWIQLKSGPNLLQLHAKINRLQVDNQMFECVFPVVLAPVPPPKSVAIDSGIKPFAELSVVQLLSKNSQIKQFKYFKVLVQEFHIKVDLGFINALFDLLQGSDYSEREEQELFFKDMDLVNQPLYLHVSSQSLQEQKSFYDLLHFSPLKIHISFSLAAGPSAGHSATPNFLNVLLQGLGVTLTDMQDVVFKLAYFEREYTFLTQKQLVSEVTRHYVGQSVKQLYVLVLGLDVLGNPYGLVLGITKGVEDLFYEPFQGAIQGPGEFAEGICVGVRSLFGHTVGGAAGAVSRITGAMGKGIAALTFDKDFQRKRRDQFNKKPATVQEGIARSGKGLVMGVFDGVTGVFTKPISGAKEEGVGGFFKGLGKGAVGLVARPTAGVVDFASGSLDAVKRAAELGEETNRLRSPRFLQADGLVRPYNRHEAEGHKILTDLEKGKYATTDIYVAHYSIIDRKEILLLTDKRLAYVTHSDLFGGWQLDWAFTWTEIQQPPTVVPKGISFTASANVKKKLFQNKSSTKVILVADPQRKEEICAKIEYLREMSR